MKKESDDSKFRRELLLSSGCDSIGSAMANEKEKSVTVNKNNIAFALKMIEFISPPENARKAVLLHR